MQDWNTFKIVWSVDATGAQTAEYFINGVSAGVAPLFAPLHNLSVEVWNDNENAQFNTTGGISISYSNIPSQQNFDVNSLTVTQD